MRSIRGTVALILSFLWMSAMSPAIEAATLDFVPSTRTVDWTKAGIPGGIPSASWPIYTTINPTGGADDSVAIQNALNAAPDQSVVLLGSGTFTLHRSSIVCNGFADDYATGYAEAGLCLGTRPDGTHHAVTLRGQGPGSTVLKYGDGANIISMGQLYRSASLITLRAISSGATKGSSSLTVSSNVGVTAGTFIVVTQNNPFDSDSTPLVNLTGNMGFCDYCGHTMPNTVMTQIVKVTSITGGTTFNLEVPLYFNFTNSPSYYVLPMTQYVGLENLRLNATAPSGTALTYKNINMEACAYCWVQSVESDIAVDKANIYLSDTYSCEISNNYLNDGYNHNSGASYGLLLEFRNSNNLLQNNIIRKARHSTPQSGSSGNVYGYNYEIDAYMGEYHNSLPEVQTHAAHPFMNLWEGNIWPNVIMDFTHGSSSHNTLFRNYMDLTNANPDGGLMTSAIIATDVAYYVNYATIVGNVMGQWPSGCTASAYETVSPAAAGTNVIFRIGYFDADGNIGPDSTQTAKVGNTLYRGGNWDCKSGSQYWASNAPSGSPGTYLASQVLPNSLYLSAKPAWFGSVSWPAIDPGAATKVNKTPAQLCYEAGPKVGVQFTPSACYLATQTTQGPAAPTGLVAVVR
jgi:hypothetical protein